jgi:hypothetical protein
MPHLLEALAALLQIYEYLEKEQDVILVPQNYHQIQASHSQLLDPIVKKFDPLPNGNNNQLNYTLID